MSWNRVIGHTGPHERFQQCAVRNRFASTYLFLGPDGIGKRTFALKLAEAILCEQNPIESLAPCGSCSGCLQVQNQSHPDLLLVSKPVDKNVLPVEMFIGRSTHRRREGLVYEFGMKPFRGGYRIAIIDDADYFNSESANCLLKTLEEPPSNSLLILLGTSQQRQLHTIVSRSQLVRFNALSPDDLLDVLRMDSTIDEGDISVSLEELAAISSGSVTRAVALSDAETFEFRNLLIQQLASGDPHAGNFSKNIVAYAEAMGKEGYRRRPRMVMLGELAIEFYRNAYWQLAGAQQTEQAQSGIADAATMAQVQNFAKRFSGDPFTGAERIAACIERTGEMQFHTTTNAQFLNIVESWLIDLGRLVRGESVTTGDVLKGMV